MFICKLCEVPAPTPDRVGVGARRRFT